ncbi:MAG: DHHA1 domain-containing protein, partial [Acidimicrobiia bacterium]
DRADAAQSLIDEIETVGDASLASGRVDGLGGDGLRTLAFQIRDRISSGVGVFASVTDGKASIIAFVTQDLVDTGISAGDIAGAGATILGGGGSRDPKLSQAGGPNADAIDEALTAARGVAHEALSAP